MKLSQEKISIFSSFGFAHFYTIGTPKGAERIGAGKAELQCFSVAWFLVPWCSLLAQHFKKGMTRRLQPVCKRRSIGQYGIFTSSIKQRGPDNSRILAALR